MSLLRYLLDNQAAGTNATGNGTTSNIASSPSGHFPTVSTGSGGLVQFADDPWDGDRCLKFTGGGAGQSNIARFPFAAAHLTGAYEVYHGAESLPPSDLDIINARWTSGHQFRTRISTGGVISQRDNAGNLLGTAAAAATWAVNRWNRIGQIYVVGNNNPTPNGSFTGHLYNNQSTSAVDDFFGSSVAEGDSDAGQLVSLEIGTPNNGNATWVHYFKIIQLNDGATSEIGPYIPALAMIEDVLATRLSSTSVSVSWTHPADAPDGVSIGRAPGTHVTDGNGASPGDSGYDPLTISGAAIITEGETASPYVDTGLTSGTYTYWAARTDA